MMNIILPFSTLTASIIGVGFFGLPYVAAKIGFYPMLAYFGVLTVISILTHQIFGEICLRTNGDHRLPGYAEIYFGKKAKWVSIFSTSLGLFGSNLAYIVVGGGFLADLLLPWLGGSQAVYPACFFAVGALLAFLGSRSISRSEFVGLIIIMAAILYMLVSSLPKIDIDNMMTYDFSPLSLFLPYGVILFSLSGMSVIPEIKDQLKSNPRYLKEIISYSIILSAIAYIVFVFFTLGVTGAKTTQDALTGLNQVLGHKVMIAGFLLGILATFTSYISSALTLKKIFIYDMKLPLIVSWTIAVSVPMLLYIFGLNDFIKIIAFVGAVTMGIDSLMIFLIYLKARKTGARKPEYQVGLARIIVYLLCLVFLAGVAGELYLTLR